ncbi:hypothetical protein AVEN_79647-1 [Araneus ventricosus]|uniref:Uncharacterized protein n=1 Tax=Araneus ventricosus TaxID=182803 RepID=A0A4Y2K4E5_ARAVE|nr:hypothetical protein AVEN_79647-1 [Araneus ventricosus]
MLRHSERSSMAEEPCGKSPIIGTPVCPKTQLQDFAMTTMANQKATDVDVFLTFSSKSHPFSHFTAVTAASSSTAEDGGMKKIAAFKIRQDPKDAFFAWKEEQMFIAIHSPFVPVNPVMDGIAVQHGFEYDFHINLEEEHLQPHPYRTNCTNYDEEWAKNNRTGPRSQEMCKELCRLTFSRRCFGCETIRLTNINPRKACLESFSDEKVCTKEAEFEKLYRCKDRCKKACK